MPVNRSPPVSPLPTPVISAAAAVEDSLARPSARLSPAPHIISLHQFASAPDLSLDSNLAERKKRKFEGGVLPASEELTRAMFSTLSNKQECQFEDLIHKINNIIDQNIELKKSVELMSEKYDEFLSRITSLEAEKRDDKRTIRQLEDKIELLERTSRATEMEIRNVPKAERETKDDLCNLVLNLGKNLNLGISQSNLTDIYRVTSKNKSSPIIVNFNSVICKEKVVQEIKKFNKTKNKEDKLNTTHFKLKVKQPVYVSERLTFKAQKLYYLARTQHKILGYNFCWTSRGIIYIRKNIGDPQIRINSEEDILKLKTPINT